MKTLEKSRFDTRLPKEQKELFEYAANLGGFRTLTEFVIFSVQQQASTIIEKYNSILATKKDQEIFFHAITNPQEPNNRLKKAALRYDKVVAKK
ncbi:MAG TPA: DUF1778 domain-containing protein [Chitinophagaceae bacterium]|nr:DUF1778 domain-containing protein [Chitinophagaceae bacterium]